MLVDFIAFFAKLIIALVILKMIEVRTTQKNPDSALGQALCFIAG